MERREEMNGPGSWERDAGEQFLLDRCALYLHRHVQRHGVGERKTLDFAWQVLGNDVERVVQHWCETLSRPLKRELEEGLEDSGLEWDERSGVVARVLGKAPGRKARTFEREVQNLLGKRVSLSMAGEKSFIEMNLGEIRDMFHLSDLETEFCAFLFVVSTCEAAEDFFVNHLGCGKFTGRKHLCNTLAFSPQEMQAVLSGTLARIDAIDMGTYDLRLKDEYLNLILNPSTATLSTAFFTPVPPSFVPLRCHFNLERETAIALQLLREKPRDSSTHILLYGPPGTGKTSFARGIVQELGVEAHEIVRDRENSSARRRGAIVACLNMTNGGPGSVILVDEADNVLGTRPSWFMRGETQDKGWLNQLLEEPGARMIWIANDTGDMDEAVLRRFSFSIRFAPLTRRQRVELWENILRQHKIKRHFTRENVNEFAGSFQVSAGAIDLSVKKAVEMGCPSGKDLRQMIKNLLEAHQTLLNSGEKVMQKDLVQRDYSVEGLNLDGDLDSLMAHVERFDHFLRSGGENAVVNLNMIFHGPPGSGKSELARYLAQRVNREVLSRRVSDLLDPHVGVSEKNLRDAFAEAESSGAVLIMDEADSMLFSRDRARYSWEISFTNEFLTQMERFRGILICTTNRLMDLDAASLRRFQVKMGFRALAPEGNRIFYERLLGPLVPGEVPQFVTESLNRIKDLCPGDFRTVRDRFAFHAPRELSHRVLLEGLEEEARLKRLHKNEKSIGFLG